MDGMTILVIGLTVIVLVLVWLWQKADEDAQSTHAKLNHAEWELEKSEGGIQELIEGHEMELLTLYEKFEVLEKGTQILNAQVEYWRDRCHDSEKNLEMVLREDVQEIQLP